MTESLSEVDRALAFRGVALRRAYVDAGTALVRVAEGVPGGAWTRPALGEWTVRDLAGHAARAFVTVTTYLETGAGKAVSVDHALDYASVYRSGYADPASIVERGRQAGRDLGADPAATLEAWRARAVADLAAHDDEAPVATPVGVMRLLDYLPSRVLGLVVHADDLASALGLAATVPSNARLVATCFAAGLATEQGDDGALLRALTGRAPLPDAFTVV